MKVTNCRVCDGARLHLFLDLGTTALANSFLAPERVGDAELRAPLRAVLCEDCGLVQIDEVIPPEVLFKHYLYVSGTSDLVKSHAAALVDQLRGQFGLRTGDLVLEVASNDGTVLQAFRGQGLRTLGIEPAENIAAMAAARGIETECAFFNRATAERVRERHGPAKVVLARHVLAHVANLRGFVESFTAVLAPEGVAVVEVPHVLPFFANLEFDTIYHEHLCYFSLSVLKTLFELAGMEVIDVRQVEIHGGSIVVAAQRRGGPWRRTPAVGRVMAVEEARGLHRPEAWRDFARGVAASRERLLAELAGLRRQGRTVAGYGAPAKGMTLLSYCGIGPDQLPYLVDKNPLKQGLYTPGHHIPVHGPEKLLADQPDVVLVLAWNFAAEIARQQAEYLGRGGQFLLPIPSAHYWNGVKPASNQAA